MLILSLGRLTVQAVICFVQKTKIGEENYSFLTAAVVKYCYG